jgi:hypothetical protein
MSYFEMNNRNIKQHISTLDDVYDRRLRKRSASEALAPTKYPPQKKLTHRRR